MTTEVSANLAWIMIGLTILGMFGWMVIRGVNSSRFDRYLKLRFRNLPSRYGSTLFWIYGTVNYNQDLPKLRGCLCVIKEPEGVLIKEVWIVKGRFFDAELLMDFPLDSLNSEERVAAVKNLRLYFINFPTLRRLRIIESDVKIVSVAETEPYSFSMTLECVRP